MPSFGFVKVSGRARNVEAVRNPEGEAAPNAGRHEDQAEDPNSTRRGRISEQKEMLKSKRQELRKVRQETSAAPASVERAEQVKKARRTKLELLALKNKHRAARGTSQGTNRSAVGGRGGANDRSAVRLRRGPEGPTDHWCWQIRSE